MIKRMCFCFMAVFLTACVSSSFHLKEGIRDFHQQNYRSAFIRLKPEAMRGQPDAQYAVGYMYYYGQGVTEDKKEALCWIRKAALQGNNDAQLALRAIHQG